MTLRAPVVPAYFLPLVFALLALLACVDAYAQQANGAPSVIRGSDGVPIITIGEPTPYIVTFATCDTLEQIDSIVDAQLAHGYAFAFQMWERYAQMDNGSGERVCGSIAGPIMVQKVHRTVTLEFPEVGEKQVAVVDLITLMYGERVFPALLVDVSVLGPEASAIQQSF